MADSAAQGRVRAAQEFAAHLATLRESVGTPSFRELAGRSHAISHTTLHAAAQGLRLPSWPTTVEFVRACGAEPEDFRARWEAADRAVNADGPDRHEPVARAAESAVEPVDAAPSPLRRTPVRVGAVVLVVGLVVAVASVVVSQVGQRRTPEAMVEDPVEASVEATVQAQCPFRLTTSSAVGAPAHAGDDAAFLGDITLPDCTRVPTGARLTKVWRLKNVGTVAWTGYSLRREDDQGRDNCQTIAEVPVADTAPGGVVDVEVRVLTPDSARLCVARFKLVDGAGLTAFPGRRTVNFQLVVDPALTVTAAPVTAAPVTSAPVSTEPTTTVLGGSDGVTPTS